MAESAKIKQTKERGGLLIFILLWLLVRGVIAVGYLPTHIYKLYTENGAYHNLLIGFTVLALLLNILQVAGAIGLIRWKRWGFIMLMLVLIVNGVLDWSTGQIMSMVQNLTLCGGLIWVMKEKAYYLE